jgi:hypothetical protein
MGMAKKPRACPRSSGGKVWNRVLMAMGSSIPPAKPCSTRPSTSTQKAGASPQSTEAAVNAARATTQTRFIVKRPSM